MKNENFKTMKQQTKVMTNRLCLLCNFVFKTRKQARKTNLCLMQADVALLEHCK